MSLIDNNKPFTFDRVIRVILSLSIIVIIYLFVNSVSTALIPFFIAWLLAYILNPIVEFVQYNLRFKNRLLSILSVLIFITAIIVGTVWIIIPSVQSEAEELIEMIRNFLDGKKITEIIPQEVQDYVTEYFRENETYKNLGLSKLTSLSSLALKITGEVFKGSYSIVLGILTSFATFLYLIFILLDFDRITLGAIGLIPIKYREKVIIVLDDVKVNMNRYFRGQSIVALLVGVLLSIGFSIIGVPLAIPLGLFIGLLNMVPYLQIVGIVPMALMALMKCASTGNNFFMFFGLMLLVLAIVQIIQDAFIVPRIMGNVTGLNPAIILLSLSVWGVLLGVIGMIIALPMTTILLSYYKRFIINKQIE
ncbi:MAG: AI-2E family transporter [Rikenellaceae bacterium]